MISHEVGWFTRGVLVWLACGVPLGVMMAVAPSPRRGPVWRGQELHSRRRSP